MEKDALLHHGMSFLPCLGGCNSSRWCVMCRSPQNGHSSAIQHGVVMVRKVPGMGSVLGVVRSLKYRAKKHLQQFYRVLCDKSMGMAVSPKAMLFLAQLSKLPSKEIPRQTFTAEELSLDIQLINVEQEYMGTGASVTSSKTYKWGSRVCAEGYVASYIHSHNSNMMLLADTCDGVSYKKK